MCQKLVSLSAFFFCACLACRKKEKLLLEMGIPSGSSGLLEVKPQPSSTSVTVLLRLYGCKHEGKHILAVQSIAFPRFNGP